MKDAAPEKKIQMKKPTHKRICIVYVGSGVCHRVKIPLVWSMGRYHSSGGIRIWHRDVHMQVK